MMTEFLTRLAGYADAEAIAAEHHSTTYRELSDDVARISTELTSAGIGPGTVVGLQTTQSAQSAAALLALCGIGAICVPLTALPAAQRAEFLAIAEVEVVMIADPHPNGTTLTRTGTVASHDLYRQLRAERSPGLVLFSSGTTGQAKATVLNVDRMLARYRQPSAGYRTLSFLHLDHIGGINTLLHTLSSGGALITVRRRAPEEVFAAIAQYSVEVLPTTPTFLTMTLIDRAFERHDVSTLRLVTYGTEPMPSQTLERLATALPDVRFKQTYGLSELGILATKSRARDSLWVKLGGPGFDYKIVDGVLWVRSQMAMLGYLNASAPFDDEGYFNTQDAVEVDGEYLHILGRTSELINVGGEKVYPNEVESALLEIENIVDVNVSGLANPVTGQVVQAAVTLREPEDHRALRTRIIRHLRPRLDAYKLPAKITIVEHLHHSERFKKMRAK